MSLVVEQLEHRYALVRALRGVSFEVPAGQIVGLIGPNGAGKTTLLRILATFLRPTAGRVFVAGFDVLRDASDVRRRLGYLPEQLPSDPVLRVREYLEFRARLKGIARRGRPAEIDRCLELCDLREVAGRLLVQLSQGFRRRVGLADALLGRPAVLLLDEPTIGLDPVQVHHTRELLSALAGTTTVLVSTHLLAEAERLCHRALVLLQGQLVSDLLVSDLRSSDGIEIELAAGAEQVGTFLRGLPGVQGVHLQSTRESVSRWLLLVDDGVLSESIAAACVTRGLGLREIRRGSRTLEDHLLRVIVRPWSEAA